MESFQNSRKLSGPLHPYKKMYAWLSVFYCSILVQILLCWINYRFVKIALISYWNDFRLIPLGEMSFLEGALQKKKKKKKVKNTNFEEEKKIEHPIIWNWE